jgi:hypothetical protein
MDQEEGAFMGKKKRRASSVHKEFLGDYLNISSNPNLSRLLSRSGESPFSSSSRDLLSSLSFSFESLSSQWPSIGV